MKLNFAASLNPLTAWGIDLGTTNSTLCRATLAASSVAPAEPEVVELRQPTQAGTFIGTLVPPFALWRGGTHDAVAACEPQGLDAQHEARNGEWASG